MRRKSTRSAAKAAEKPQPQPTPSPKRTRRTSRRRKPSTSESSNEDSDDNVPLKMVAATTTTTTQAAADVQPEAVHELAPKSSPSSSPDEAVWTVTNACDSNPPTGEIQKLKICLARPSPEKGERRRRNRSSRTDEDDERDNESAEAEESKGKSKSKSKSKSDRGSAPIRGNAQVTTQSPPTVEESDSMHAHDPDNVDDAPVARASPNATADDNVPNESLASPKPAQPDKPSSIDSNEEKRADLTDTNPSEEPLQPSKSNESCSPERKQEPDKPATTAEPIIIDITEEDTEQHPEPVRTDEADAKVSPDTPEETVVQENAEEAIVEKNTEEQEEAVSEKNTEEEAVLQKDTEETVLQKDTDETVLRKEKEETVLQEKTEETKEMTNNIIHLNNNQGTMEIPSSAIVEEKTTELHDEDVVMAEMPQTKEIIAKPKGKKIDRNVEEVDDNRPEQPYPKWQEKFLDIERHVVNVTTDLFSKIVPELNLLDEEDVRMEIDVKERQKRYEVRVSVDHKSDNEKETEENEEVEPETDTSNIIAMNRKISIVDDTASKMKPPPSPAKHIESEVLFITNLVRPFTLKQLKELLERTGKIKENGFWTDHIKSKCYVCYETVEEAVATRNALHGVHWPIGNGKKLVIDFATEDDVEKARNPPPPVIVPTPAENPEIQKPQKKLEDPPVVRESEKKNEVYVREWDIGKEDMYEVEKPYNKGYEAREKNRRRRTPTPEYPSRKQKKIEEEVPQKLMDDLFNKTKATPSIYWLPLTPDEITLKQQQRLQRMAEHKRRLEETSSSSSHRGRGGPFRRRYD